MGRKESNKMSYLLILGNGEVIAYHIFISVVVIELSVWSLNTWPEDRLTANHLYGRLLEVCASAIGAEISRTRPYISLLSTIYLNSLGYSGSRLASVH